MPSHTSTGSGTPGVRALLSGARAPTHTAARWRASREPPRLARAGAVSLTHVVRRAGGGLRAPPLARVAGVAARVTRDSRRSCEQRQGSPTSRNVRAPGVRSAIVGSAVYSPWRSQPSSAYALGVGCASSKTGKRRRALSAAAGHSGDGKLAVLFACSRRSRRTESVSNATPTLRSGRSPMDSEGRHKSEKLSSRTRSPGLLRT